MLAQSFISFRPTLLSDLEITVTQKYFLEILNKFRFHHWQASCHSGKLSCPMRQLLLDFILDFFFLFLCLWWNYVNVAWKGVKLVYESEKIASPSWSFYIIISNSVNDVKHFLSDPHRMNFHMYFGNSVNLQTRQVLILFSLLWTTDFRDNFLIRIHQIQSARGNFLIYRIDILLRNLTLTKLWANSAVDKLMIFFLENRIWHFMQICMKCQILFSRKNKKIFQNFVCSNFYPGSK